MPLLAALGAEEDLRVLAAAGSWACAWPSRAATTCPGSGSDLERPAGATREASRSDRAIAVALVNLASLERVRRQPPRRDRRPRGSLDRGETGIVESVGSRPDGGLPARDPRARVHRPRASLECRRAGPADRRGRRPRVGDMPIVSSGRGRRRRASRTLDGHDERRLRDALARSDGIRGRGRPLEPRGRRLLRSGAASRVGRRRASRVSMLPPPGSLATRRSPSRSRTARECARST